ncbi:hypothetical protein ALI144C_38595 [Actinosynnema sp. ALI-1.44]|uniref:DUF397 domain-containing protein n=1 Tax=Actinosynnema sp. ALI-1.44 TaxID=1933779 RepID=UPI00097C8006|nr:DUF397 domain-containing protein [Actinosynnema sp. ALI-1.44]ONI74726.1 hypothetical protein ALI144C_38595 [Actinosynnema sp. ALI-1.44]
MPDAKWFKSSRCGPSAACVEVAFLPDRVPDRMPGRVAVRDSKNPGPAFTFDGSSWRAFLSRVPLTCE